MSELLAEHDFVIVGAGSAGCVLANRLSANPDTTVLLIEAGGSDRYHWVDIPVGYLFCMGNPRTVWLMKTEAEPGLNGRALNYPRGKVLGGCSSINGMIYMRGQSADYDDWQRGGERGMELGRCAALFPQIGRSLRRSVCAARCRWRMVGRIAAPGLAYSRCLSRRGNGTWSPAD